MAIDCIVACYHSRSYTHGIYGAFLAGGFDPGSEKLHNVDCALYNRPTSLFLFIR